MARKSDYNCHEYSEQQTAAMQSSATVAAFQTLAGSLKFLRA
jgi:hypothetical protein